MDEAGGADIVLQHALVARGNANVGGIPRELYRIVQWWKELAVCVECFTRITYTRLDRKYMCLYQKPGHSCMTRFICYYRRGTRLLSLRRLCQKRYVNWWTWQSSVANSACFLPRKRAQRPLGLSAFSAFPWYRYCRFIWRWGQQSRRLPRFIRYCLLALSTFPPMGKKSKSIPRFQDSNSKSSDNGSVRFTDSSSRVRWLMYGAIVFC